MGQAFPLHFCILQAIESWTAGRPGDEANFYPLSKGFANQWKSLNVTNTEAENESVSIRLKRAFQKLYMECEFGFIDIIYIPLDVVPSKLAYKRLSEPNTCGF